MAEQQNSQSSQFIWVWTWLEDLMPIMHVMLLFLFKRLYAVYEQYDKAPTALRA